MNIKLVTIPHEEQRYPTVGDWVVNGDNLYISVSKMDDPRYELLVAVHELVEVLLCKERGIPQELVDKFDMEYEASRSEWDTTSEPGDAASAPYRKEHFFATSIERLLAAELGVDWKKYEAAVEAL